MKWTGVPITSGCAVGTVKIKGRNRGMREAAPREEVLSSPAQKREAEERFERGLRRAMERVENTYEKARRTLSDADAEIFLIHREMLKDPELGAKVKERIHNQGMGAETAVRTVMDAYAGLFDTLEDDYLRARKQDVLEAEELLLEALREDGGTENEENGGGEILIVRELMTKDLLNGDFLGCAGIAAETGGETAHASILCRCMGIPFVCGLRGLLEGIGEGETVIVDADQGLVFTDPTPQLLEEYRNRGNRWKEGLERLRKCARLPAATADGRNIRLWGNVTGLPEARQVLENGAEGIGLYRTEFLFMENDHLPDEEEQFRIYHQMAELLGNRGITIRTLDIGGDKTVKHMELPKEANPFLGVRGVRYCLRKPEIFRTQLRAILRASAAGQFRIMIPMVSTLEEVRSVKKLLEEIKEELKAEGRPFDETIPFGIMIEVPAAAVMADLFFREVDFISVGTNDLCQYLMAADRTNEQVTALYQDTNPALLRVLLHIFSEGQRAGKDFGVCGEMAGKTELVPLLLGMGLREFSMGASALLPVREAVRGCDLKACETLARKATACCSPEEVNGLLRAESIRRSVPS